jgi:hypothetical protein
VAAADPERWALRMAVRLWRTRVLLSPLLRLAAALWVPVSRLTGIPVRVSLPRPPLASSPRALPHPIPKLLPPWRRNWNANRMGLS